MIWMFESIGIVDTLQKNIKYAARWSNLKELPASHFG